METRGGGKKERRGKREERGTEPARILRAHFLFSLQKKEVKGEKEGRERKRAGKAVTNPLFSFSLRKRKGKKEEKGGEKRREGTSQNSDIQDYLSQTVFHGKKKKGERKEKGRRDRGERPRAIADYLSQQQQLRNIKISIYRQKGKGKREGGRKIRTRRKREQVCARNPGCRLIFYF